MAEARPRALYANPPIVEAIVSIEYDALQSSALDDLRRFGSHIQDQYPNQASMFFGAAQIAFGPTSAGTSHHQQENGVHCATSDQKRQVQLTLNSLTVRRLAPYGSWAEFEQQIHPIWDAFAAAIPIQPRVVGVRYINRIDIPLNIPMERYLRTYPEISRDLPQVIGPFFLKLNIPIDDYEVTIQQGFVAPSSPGEYAVLLDDDLRFAVSGTDAVWTTVLRAHEEKNRIFEACITDDLRERFR